MNQKQVKIIGLTLNKPMGIINAQKLIFDNNNKLIVFKGEVGSGKTTMQKALRLSTHGAKILTDNQLYGDIDNEVQLLDGDLPLFIGCRNKGKKLIHTLYIKDINGKIIKEPIIDGIKATPAKYLETLQTALTWRMNELTSESPAIQKKILLQLYQSQLSKIGVIFDKKHPDYELSILGQIDKAEQVRNDKDYYRKTKGGIADDLKLQGFDPDRPESCPDAVDVLAIENEIKQLEKEKNIKEAAPESAKQTELAEIKAKASEITNKCVRYNSELKAEYDKEVQLFDEYTIESLELDQNIEKLKILLKKLDIEHHLGALENDIKFPEKIKEPINPNYIEFDEKNQVLSSTNWLNEKSQILVNSITELRQEYSKVFSQTSNIDTDYIIEKIALQEQNKKDAIEINKIVDAIDSFHQWRKSNEDVFELKSEYVKLLAKVDTGVDGLKIIPNEDDLFLMYNGIYDSAYFNNINVSLKPIDVKLSEYIKYEHIAKYVKNTNPSHYFAIDKNLNIIKSDITINSNDCLVIFRNHNELSENDIINEFKNKKLFFYGKMRKLSSYSGTQKPVICLLIQNYLLSKKPKALRYMFIDDIPHDKKTRKLLEQMTNELDLNIFLNWTGDFEQRELNKGEILIKGGEIFFK